MEKEIIPKELAHKLNKYAIIPPDEDHVLQTVLMASRNLHKQESLGCIGIMQLAIREIRFYEKKYYLLVAVLFLIGLYANQLFRPGLGIIMLSPLPALIGFTQIIRQDIELELEMTCRYSFTQLLAARLLVVESIGVLFTLQLAFLSGENILHQMLMGVTPLLILTCVLLIGVMHWRSESTPVFVALGWCMLCFGMQYIGTDIYKTIGTINSFILAGACTVALAIIFTELKLIAATGFPLNEGGIIGDNKNRA